jgi:hypothetical protein
MPGLGQLNFIFDKNLVMFETIGFHDLPCKIEPGVKIVGLVPGQMVKIETKKLVHLIHDF